MHKDRQLIIIVGDDPQDRIVTKIESECPEDVKDGDCRACKLLSAAIIQPDDMRRDHGPANEVHVGWTFFYDKVPFGIGKADEEESVKKSFSLVEGAKECCRVCIYMASPEYRNFPHRQWQH